MENKEDKFSKTQNVIVESAGAAVSTIIGTAIAGPAGTVIGAALGPVITEGFSEVMSRALSKKERERVARVNDVVKEKIEENIKAGKDLRDDDFFTAVDGRSSADEIYEGVLIASQKEYEEKKLELLGRLFANIAFDKAISRQIANALIKNASELTYQEIKIIKVVGELELVAKNGLDPRKRVAEGRVSGLTNVSIASDIHNLYVRSIIHSSQVIFGPAGIVPSKLCLMGYGALLIRLMELERTGIDDIEINILKFLTGDRFVDDLTQKPHSEIGWQFSAG